MWYVPSQVIISFSLGVCARVALQGEGEDAPTDKAFEETLNLWKNRNIVGEELVRMAEEPEEKRLLAEEPFKFPAGSTLNPGTLIEMFATVEPNFSTLSESKVAAEIRAIASTQAPIVKNAADGEHSFRYVLTPGEDPVSLFWYSCTTVLVP